MDFRKDIADAARGEIANLGYDVTCLNDNDEEAVVAYFRIQRHHIPIQPREVREPSDFVCPTENEDGLTELRKAIERGDDLNPYRSKGVKNLANRPDPDPLFDHWNIRHLHLGTATDASGFIERSKHILFVQVNEKTVDFIKIYPHGTATWTKTEMLQIIHDNWPETIAWAKQPGVTSVYPEYDETDLAALRKVHVTTILAIGDSYYVEPGIGVLGDGTHWFDRRDSDRYMRKAKYAEDFVRTHWQEIQKAVQADGFHINSPTTLQWVQEEQSDHGTYWTIRNTDGGGGAFRILVSQ